MRIAGLLWLLLGAGLSPAAAQTAQPALRPTLSASVVRDDNLFRLSDAANAQNLLGTAQRHDWITALAAGADADLRLGGQRVLLGGHLAHTQFARFDRLDYSAANVNTRWLWQATEDLGADLAYSRTRRLANFADFRTAEQNLRTIQQFTATARRGLRSQLKLRGQLGALHLDNSFARSRDGDRRDTWVESGLDYVSDAGNTAGLQLRYTEGELPERELIAGSLVDNAHEQWDLEAVVNWRRAGQTLTIGRAGYTRRSHAQLAQRNFSGLTANLSHDWYLTGKTTLNLGLQRSIGATDDVTANYVLTDALSVSALWQATAKTRLRARAESRRRSFEGDAAVLLLAATQRVDRDRILSLAAEWQTSARLRLEARLSRERRTSNQALLDYATSELLFTGNWTY